MNAVKHGMTATTPVLPGEDPDAFRDRLDAWAEALAPADAVEQFLVEQAATASWKIERADRIEAARLFAALRAAEDEQRAGRRKEADRLGRLLLGIDGPAADPALAQEALRILDPGSPAPLADRRLPSGRSSTAWSRPPRDAPGCSSAGPSSAPRSSGAPTGTRTGSSGPSGSRGGSR